MRFLGFFLPSEADRNTDRLTLPPTSFNYDSDAHRGLIGQQVDRFNKALADLQTVDDHILMGAGIVTASWLTCGFLPLTTVGMVVSSYVGYCGATRSEYDRRYRDAQQDLIALYQWAMGKDSGNIWYKLGVKDVQNLIVTLGPWVNKETIHTWRSDDLKPSGFSALTSTRRSDVPADIENVMTQLAAGVHMNTVKFRLYGEGSVDKLLSSIKDNLMSKVTALTMSYKPS